MKTRTRTIKEYQCAVCKEWFELDEAFDKEAREECKRVWGMYPDEQFEINCDDCQKIVDPLLPEHKDSYKRALDNLRK